MNQIMTSVFHFQIKKQLINFINLFHFIKSVHVMSMTIPLKLDLESRPIQIINDLMLPENDETQFMANSVN